MSPTDDALDTDGFSSDGRTARRERNRELVLDAVLELFTEGALEPAAGDVADRSGVSLRSVYRYFDDTEALIRAAIARNVDKVRPLAEIPDLGQGPLPTRIDRIVTNRVRLFETVAPMWRATLRRVHSNEILRETVQENLVALRQQVAEMFEPELSARSAADAADTLARLDILLSFASVDHLRVNLGMDLVGTCRVLTGAIAAQLAT